VLDEHRIMTLAANRADGWPQVTIVGYVNDGYLLYCFVGGNSQKHGSPWLFEAFVCGEGIDGRRRTRVSLCCRINAQMLSGRRRFSVEVVYRGLRRNHQRASFSSELRRRFSPCSIIHEDLDTPIW
jgi:hypothetical protein